jgi:hypothetical protein
MATLGVPTGWFVVWCILLPPATITLARANVALVPADERHSTANRWWIAVNHGAAWAAIASAIGAFVTSLFVGRLQILADGVLALGTLFFVLIQAAGRPRPPYLT